MPCNQTGLECEYGTLADPSCNTVEICDSSTGTWQNDPSFSSCPWRGPNGSDCPATFAEVKRGSTCSTVGEQCNYAIGGCQCTTSLGGVVSGSPEWQCDDPQPPSCPMPRPALGSACTPMNGGGCSYFPCWFEELCNPGPGPSHPYYWQPQFEACAGANGP